MRQDLLARQLRELPFFRATLRAVESRFLTSADLPEPTLDVGAGDGHFASVTFDHVLAVGLDPDLSSLREAQGRNAYRILVQADGARMPHPDGHFASALSNSVLEHIPSLDQVLAETGRVLRSGAPFVFTVPNPGYRDKLSLPRWLSKIGLSKLGEAYRGWFMRMSRTWNLLDEEDWQRKLNAAGFDLESSQRYFSPEALRALEWGHYFGVPSLIVRWLTGRWILVPTAWNLSLTDRAVRRYFEEEPSDNGTYTYFRARKR
ncbi:MAG: class I SAM-dependent methyltransferase [Anaerolineales bacterium]|nr:class I SAM-dependent methyltransferase [Anaerolineales bacterium]